MTEEAIFDRQTRLWGAEAQAKIRSSKVLIRGEFLGLASEICKNLVLAGVNVVLFDQPSATVTRQDISCNVFFRKDDVDATMLRTSETVLDRIRDMTFAEVSTYTTETQSIADFKVVVSVNESFETMLELNARCRQEGIPLLCCREAGMYGLVLLDFGKEFTYRKDAAGDVQTYTSQFVPLQEMFDFTRFHDLPSKTSFGFYSLLLATASPQDEVEVRAKRMKTELLSVEKYQEVERAWKVLTDVHRSSLPPICTILGGLVGNEVLKAVSGKGEPVNNALFFDGKDGSAEVRRIPPKGQ